MIKRFMAVALLAAAMPVQAILIDFEDLAEGFLAGDTVTITAGGVDVTFSGPGLQVRQFGVPDPDPTPYPETRVLSTDSDIGPITVTFGVGISVSLASVENIINGRYDTEVDQILGEAFDAGNNLVDSANNSNDSLVLAGAGIVRLVYREGLPAKGFVMDNFEFFPEQQQAPAPGTLLLLGAGLLGLRAMRRKSR